MKTATATQDKNIANLLRFAIFALACVVVLSGCTQPVVLDAPAAASAETGNAPAAEAVSTADLSSFPVTIENCGVTTTYDAPPARAVTMNQSVTEIMLALGLEGSMVGTAYMDDTILPAFAEAYESVPVLAETYPSREILLAAEPDFVYAAYSSAFGDDAAGSRASLAELGIDSYLQVVACEDRALRPDKASFDTVYDEIRDIGAIFGVSDRAEALIADMQAQLDDVLTTIGDDLTPYSILWYDSGTDEVFAGACCGTPNMIIEAVGAVNAFSDLEGNWQTVNWETVIERNPDAMVLVEASWDTNAQKRAVLADPAYVSITAVQDQRFVDIPFSATTLGVRNVMAVQDLAKGLYPEKFTESESAGDAVAASPAGFPVQH